MGERLAREFERQVPEAAADDAVACCGFIQQRRAAIVNLGAEIMARTASNRFTCWRVFTRTFTAQTVLEGADSIGAELGVYGYDESRHAHRQCTYTHGSIDSPPDQKTRRGLGVAFDRGVGVDRSEYEAMCRYRMAANSGHMEAQNNLAYLYETALVKDMAEAVK